MLQNLGPEIGVDNSSIRFQRAKFSDIESLNLLNSPHTFALHWTGFTDRSSRLSVSPTVCDQKIGVLVRSAYRVPQILPFPCSVST